MEELNSEVKADSIEDKANEGENIAAKDLISVPPTMEFYFGIGGSIDSELFKEWMRGGGV